MKDIWGPTDVYSVTHLPKDAQVLVLGQVLTGMKPDDPPVEGAEEQSHDAAGLAARLHRRRPARPRTIFTTTMGAAVDLESEGLRRLLVNACYYLTGLQKNIPAAANVDYVAPSSRVGSALAPSKRDLDHKISRSTNSGAGNCPGPRAKIRQNRIAGR